MVGHLSKMKRLEERGRINGFIHSQNRDLMKVSFLHFSIDDLFTIFNIHHQDLASSSLTSHVFQTPVEVPVAISIVVSRNHDATFIVAFHQHSAIGIGVAFQTGQSFLVCGESKEKVMWEQSKQCEWKRAALCVFLCRRYETTDVPGVMATTVLLVRISMEGAKAAAEATNKAVTRVLNMVKRWWFGYEEIKAISQKNYGVSFGRCWWKASGGESFSKMVFTMLLQDARLGSITSLGCQRMGNVSAAENRKTSRQYFERDLTSDACLFLKTTGLDY